MKRFTATEKWSDPWFRKLPPKLKCLWIYICDNCDPAGVIDLDLELAAVQIGAKLEREDLANFTGRIEPLESGKLLVVKFIPFQFGQLSADCRPHKSVFDALSKHGLEYPFGTLSVSFNGVPATPQEQDKDKDKEKDTNKTEGVQGEPLKARGTVDELRSFAVELGLPASDGEACFDKWQGNGWKNGQHAVRDWKATIRSWKAQGYLPSQKNGSKGTGTLDKSKTCRLRPGEGIPVWDPMTKKMTYMEPQQ